MQCFCGPVNQCGLHPRQLSGRGSAEVRIKGVGFSRTLAHVGIGSTIVVMGSLILSDSPCLSLD